jgi:hypothetical protein
VVCSYCDAPEPEQGELFEKRARSFDEVLAEIGEGGYKPLKPGCGITSFPADDIIGEEVEAIKAALGIPPDDT